MSDKCPFKYECILINLKSLSSQSGWNIGLFGVLGLQHWFAALVPSFHSSPASAFPLSINLRLMSTSLQSVLPVMILAWVLASPVAHLMSFALIPIIPRFCLSCFIFPRTVHLLVLKSKAKTWSNQFLGVGHLDTYITVVGPSSVPSAGHPQLPVDHRGPKMGQSFWQRCHSFPASGPGHQRQHRVDILAARITARHKGNLNIKQTSNMP